MALVRVQGTGKVSQAVLSGSISLTFATPPAVGNGVIVEVIGWRGVGLTFSPTGCTDNRGHTYLQAATLANPAAAAVAIYYLPVVATSAAPFTITVTGAVSSCYFQAAAIEVSGVGSGLAVDQTAAQTGSGTAVTTGASPAVTAAEVFVAAAHVISANQASLIVEVLSPVWTEEFENLNYSATIAGEGDTRVRSSAAGTTQTGNWTAATSGQYAAVLAAFSAGTTPAATARVSQLVTETLSHPTPDARVTQLVVETLSLPAAAAAATSRVTQLVAETLTHPTGTTLNAVITQFVTETLTSTPVIPGAFVTQQVVETLTATPFPPSPVRVSQSPLELLDQYPTTARISQAPVEIIDQYPTAAFVSQSPVELVQQHVAALTAAAVSQAPLEIIYPYGCYIYVPPLCPTTDFPLDDDSEGACAAPILP